MTNRKKAWTLAGCAGLAMSGAASAQLQIVDNISGEFVDISSTGTLIAMGDDEIGPVSVSAAVANGAFPAGVLSACTNGHVGYAAETDWSNDPLPDADFYNGGRAAAVFWDDLKSNVGGSGVYAQEIQENGQTVLVIEWVRMDHYSMSPDQATFELKIYGGGNGPGGAVAQFLYAHPVFGDPTVDNGASATIGYQVSSGSAVQYSYNSPSVSDGTVLSLVFTGPTGACCLIDGCSLMDEAACSSSGGVFRGAGTTCSTSTCPQGACCTSEGCLIITEAACIAGGGAYHGDNSTCQQAGCPQNLVCNGGFEAGDFGPCWTQFGNTGFSAVNTGVWLNTSPHGGMYESHFGPLGAPGGIQQTLSGVQAGQMVTVDFWYAIDATTPNFFSADLGGVSLVSYQDDTSHPSWTHFVMTLAAPSNDPVLTFTMQHDPQYVYLDDIFVSPEGGTPQGCYANCDGGTQVPFLNINDFICFQTQFAAGCSAP